jgi:hypothetical protein
VEAPCDARRKRLRLKVDEERAQIAPARVAARELPPAARAKGVDTAQNAKVRENKDRKKS